mmetsp:Transcript_76357/g.200344  ORF Transcript_76357/g.200344 Transcript_76357/m.200344 type:complete len:623 (+) Transcript_76357:103-1971(+)
MAYSSGVKLGDLDDFINLAQDCVAPLIEAAAGNGKLQFDSSITEAKSKPVVAPVEVMKPNLIKSKVDPTTKAQIGQVTLSDCLACSGCVTSAETVLLQEQSGDQFRKAVSESPITVVTISAQACASLAVAAKARGEPSILVVLQKMAHALRRLGATYVLDNSAAEAVALLEGSAEFQRRFREAQKGAAPKRGLLGMAKASGSSSTPLPLLTSHCPGWALYAEKVVDPVIIPHLAPFRPPQQIQGRLVKTCLLEAHNRRRLHRWWRVRSPLFAAESAWWLRKVTKADDEEGCKPLAAKDVYHVTVQPCFDRKIEAARPSFSLDEDVKEVDTVLTTTELLDLAMNPEPLAEGAEAPAPPTPEETADALAALPSLPLDSEVLTDLLLQDLRTARPGGLLPTPVAGNGGSGGFVEHVFREAARGLFQIELDAAPLVFKIKQNEDMREVVLEDPKTKKVLLRFLTAYGFRNIQNIIRRVAKAESGDEASHFVEIMACPGGCLNGGGQIPEPKRSGQAGLGAAGADAGQAGSEEPLGGTAKRRQRLGELEAAFHSGESLAVTPPAQHPLVPELYRYMADRAQGEKGGAQGVDRSVGSPGVKAWLAADWKSLKVDDAGNAVVSASVLKW